MTTRSIPLSQIIVPDDIHRVDIDDQALKDLALSISQIGLLHPITVTDNANDTYTLRAGHRRYLAHIELGRPNIEATVFNGSERDAHAARFAENLARVNLSPMEEARAIHAEHYENLTPRDVIARMLNRTVDWVNQRLDLMDMPSELCDLVHQGALPIGSALALATISDVAHRRYLQTYAQTAGATVTVVREWVRHWELAQQPGSNVIAILPPMPEPGQPVVVTMPCHICGHPHPYQELRVTRVCGDCTRLLESGLPTPADVSA